MINPALAILEEVYEIALNPTLSYAAQLETLSASGELSNKKQTNEILFRLCELVDTQAKQIKALKEDREQIASEMTRLEGIISAPTTNPAVSDPTQPLT